MSESPNPPAPPPEAIDRVEIMLAKLLRYGVGASILIIVIGFATTLARHPNYVNDPRALTPLMDTSAGATPGAAFPHTLADLGRELADFRGRAIVTIGLLLLILTPVMRVAACVVTFMVQRDWRFAVLTAIVLAVLILSFVLGKVG